MGRGHLRQGGFKIIFNIMPDAICRKCRAAGQKLFLKGEKCFSSKCPMVRKSYRPGVHKRGNKRPGALSEYGKQLLEKQKVRWSYGIGEAQMRKYFELAKKESKNKNLSLDESLLRQLERRLDNVVFRLGFAASRAQARQFVSYGHVLVNGRKVTIPSYQVREGETIEIKSNSRILKLVKELVKPSKKFNLLPWLERLKDKIGGKVVRMPKLEDFQIDFDLSLVVEFYSR